MDALKGFSRYAHWGLRIAVAGVFLYHGLQKVTNPGGGAMLGMSSALWLLVGLFETGGGALVLLGSFLPDWATRLGGLLIMFPMLGAIAKVHWGRWSFVPTEAYPMGGMEFQFTLLMLGLFFLLRGKDVEAPAA
ncbi:MAG TPA: DoxX family protein [Chloroflexi bacterium]|nr:DoxX family protein [Chloroflexota bacterium]